MKNLEIQKTNFEHRARNLKEYHWTKLSSFFFGVLTFCRFWFKKFEKTENMKNYIKKYFITNINIHIAAEPHS